MTWLVNAFLGMKPVLLLLDSGTPAESTKSAFSDNGIFGAVLMLLVMLAIIVGAYFVTRWIASGAMRLQRGSRMRVVDRLPLARDKSIIVVEIGGAYYAVGVSGNSVNLICELPLGAYDEPDEPFTPGEGGWRAMLRQSMSAPQKREPHRGEPQRGEPQRREPRRRVDEDELTRMAERMRKRSQSMNNREDGHEED